MNKHQKALAFLGGCFFAFTSTSGQSFWDGGMSVKYRTPTGRWHSAAANGASQREGENMSKHPGGRPPFYNTAEEMQEQIDAYFEECKGHKLVDDEGRTMRDKYGYPIFVDARPLTITGLALALGFNSRQALLNYQAKDEFYDTILRAKARVECYAEERLFDKDGANGAKFSLANNFEGWKEKQQIEAEVNSDMNICIELSDD